MKKFFIIIFLTAIASGCKKDHPVTKSEEGTQKVTFKVGFSQSSTGFLGTATNHTLHNNALSTNADTAITNHVKGLTYGLFDSTGTYMRSNVQNGEHLNEINETLAPGTYTIVIAAGSTDVEVRFPSPAPANNLDNAYIWNFRRQELFFKKITFTVGASPVTENVSLRRVSSYLKVNFSDPLPQDANRIVITTTNNSRFLVGTEKFTYHDNGARFSSWVVPDGQPNYTAGLVLYCDEVSTNVLIKVTKSSPTEQTGFDEYKVITTYANNYLTNVPFKQNAVTTISGNFFNGNSTGSSLQGNGIKMAIDTARSAQ